jgi:hypothetical protein
VRKGSGKGTFDGVCSRLVAVFYWLSIGRLSALARSLVAWPLSALGPKREGREPSRHVRFTADSGSADGASGVYEFMT